MTDKEAYILRELYTGGGVVPRSFSFFYRPETKAGLRDYAAAQELQKRGLATVTPGVNPNMWRVSAKG